MPLCRARALETASRALAGLVVTALVAVAPACLRRDVATEQPTTKISFETVIPQPAIDKVDVLVMVDNSSSMADKQRILASALPDLVTSLVRPKCVDVASRAPTGALADPLKPEGAQCAPGSEPAFKPITDMHLGVVSSSLGGFGSTACAAAGGRHEDDRGHLLARGPVDPVAAAGDMHFLAWYPDVEANRDKARHPDPLVPKTSSVEDLADAFRDLVVGAGQDGCGFEAQLESVYRFLVQPDPWTGIQVSGGRATYGDDVDAELLRQRAAFLRPDSLVAVIVLSDEDDSSVDPLSFSGSAFRFEDPTPMPRATGNCATDPSSPDCTSCAFAPSDPSCAAGGGSYTADEDPLNVRFYRMKQRFGVDPQYPIQRYVDGFTKPRVPRRADEHDASGRYAPTPSCTNPLFAARLPMQPGDELCKLPRGPRTPDLVYFAVIGGVPNQLLGGDKLDWTRILGRDPARWDETGIDPHMIPSTTPRPGLPPPTAADDADPIHGREWTTGGKDLQYACTFPLYAEAADGTIAPVSRTCSPDERRAGLCDCDGVKDPPVCAATDRSVQVKGKAYPTRRELMVAKELGDHAVVASLCPEQLTAPDRDDYGYRPAIAAIAAKLVGSLTAACLPRALVPGDDHLVPCAVMAILPDPGPQSDCETLYGLAPGRPELIAPMRDTLAASDGDAVRSLPMCEVPQRYAPDARACRQDGDGPSAVAFCYAAAAPGAACSQGLTFTAGTDRLRNARFVMQCIQQSDTASAGSPQP
jgi:hypothetical protein